MFTLVAWRRDFTFRLDHEKENDMQDLKEYGAELREKFAQFGFLTSPLSPAQIIRCKVGGLELNEAFGVGCDVAAGFPFDDSVSLTYAQRDRMEAYEHTNAFKDLCNNLRF